MIIGHQSSCQNVFTIATYNDSLLANFLDDLSQLLLDVTAVSEKADSVLVSLSADHLVTKTSKPIVETPLGASLGLGQELLLDSGSVFTIRNIKEDSKSNVFVRGGHDYD